MAFNSNTVSAISHVLRQIFQLFSLNGVYRTVDERHCSILVFSISLHFYWEIFLLESESKNIIKYELIPL